MAEHLRFTTQRKSVRDDAVDHAISLVLELLAELLIVATTAAQLLFLGLNRTVEFVKHERTVEQQALFLLFLQASDLGFE